MKHKSILGIELIILSLLLFSTLGGLCCWDDDIEETPPDSTGCGHGEGHYGVGINSGPPSSFNCNLQGNFQMEFYPSIHETYGGFNRFHFELKKGSAVYRSNYVEFDSGYWAVEQVEWGGSLPSGEYKVTGILENIQLSSTCRDSIYTHWDVNLGEVDIIEFANPDKVMQIEYFCQDSDIDTIDSYDVFLSPHTAEYCSIAFSIANTRGNVTTYQTDLPDSLILADFEAVRRYIADHKQLDNEMFLCGIRGFRDYQGGFIVNLLGLTNRDTITFAPTCSTGSLVAVKACMDIVADKYKIDYNDFVAATTIHELGWQRAIKPSDQHDSKFCIMHVGLVVDTSEVAFNRHSNPHFCSSCITKLGNVSW